MTETPFFLKVYHTYIEDNKRVQRQLNIEKGFEIRFDDTIKTIKQKIFVASSFEGKVPQDLHPSFLRLRIKDSDGNTIVVDPALDIDEEVFQGIWSRFQNATTRRNKKWIYKR